MTLTALWGLPRGAAVCPFNCSSHGQCLQAGVCQCSTGQAAATLGPAHYHSLPCPVHEALLPVRNGREVTWTPSHPSAQLSANSIDCYSIGPSPVWLLPLLSKWLVVLRHRQWADHALSIAMLNIAKWCVPAGFNGQYCEGSEVALPFDTPTSGSMGAGQWAYFTLVLLANSGSWRTNGIQLAFAADGGQPSLLAKRGRYPTFADNDVRMLPRNRLHDSIYPVLKST